MGDESLDFEPSQRGGSLNFVKYPPSPLGSAINQNREIKLDVTWSYVKRQTAKTELLPSVFSSLNSRVKIFVFVPNSRRHFSIFM